MAFCLNLQGAKSENPQVRTEVVNYFTEITSILMG